MNWFKKKAVYSCHRCDIESTTLVVTSNSMAVCKDAAACQQRARIKANYLKRGLRPTKGSKRSARGFYQELRGKQA